MCHVVEIHQRFGGKCLALLQDGTLLYFKLPPLSK